MDSKKGESTWIWVLLLIVVITAGVFFVLFFSERPSTYDSSASIPPQQTGLTFPQNIGTYSLEYIPSPETECIGTLCLEVTAAEYKDQTSNNVVFVNIGSIITGTQTQLIEFYEDYVSEPEEVIINGNILHRMEESELIWFTGEDSPAMIVTREGTIAFTPEGDIYHYDRATGNNAVTQEFLYLYPSYTG